MSKNTATLFFILAILSFLVAFFFDPIKESTLTFIDNIDSEAYSSSQEYDNESDFEVFPPPPPPPPMRIESNTDTKVYDFVDVMPVYPGGINQLRKEVQRNFKIPIEYKDSGKRGGTIVTSFVVNANGEIGEIEILKALGDCDACSREAERAIRSIKSSFSPGKQSGEPVAVKYSLPISIKIE